MNRKEKQRRSASNKSEFSLSIFCKRYAKHGIISMVILSLFLNGKIYKVIGAYQATSYMEHKYHESFMLMDAKVLPWMSVAYVSPKDEQSRKIKVEIAGDAPWKMQFTDSYGSDISTEYLRKRLKPYMKSAYSQKYFYAAVNYIEPQYEGKYTIEEIAQGPEVAPNAYSKPNLGIHLYCKREDREAAIREQWETLRKMKADGINMDHWTGGIKVSDEELLQEKPELLKCYEDADLGNSEMILLDEYQDGRVWIFSGDYAVVSQGFYNFYNDYNNSHNANAQ